MRIVHFLLHVPKCAGTTVEAHFRKHLGARFMIAPRWESPMRNFIGNRYPGLSPQAMADEVAHRAFPARCDHEARAEMFAKMRLDRR
ncbi:MAG: hypothetical protein AAFY39_17745, partial [Pseudomonadota bacterium]